MSDHSAPPKDSNWYHYLCDIVMSAYCFFWSISKMVRCVSDFTYVSTIVSSFTIWSLPLVARSTVDLCRLFCLELIDACPLIWDCCYWIDSQSYSTSYYWNFRWQVCWTCFIFVVWLFYPDDLIFFLFLNIFWILDVLFWKM